MQGAGPMDLLNITLTNIAVGIEVEMRLESISLKVVVEIVEVVDQAEEIIQG